ncbi:MAG TPA: recombinase family protein, partial [Casimicrobiaceae bacterium]
LSRDMVDGESMVRRLEHRGIRIIGIGDGYDSDSGESRELLRGVRGLFNQSYIRDAAKKTHRGLTGQVLRGFHAGGMSYGYRSLAVDMNERGEAAGFRLEIVEEQAEIVRWIFDRYGDGWSCQRIAADLNARGVRGPGRKRTKPSTWSTSALYGSPAKGSGILNNTLYRGEYVWNRSRWVKNPDTGQRERQIRPEPEWQRVAREDLRIVSDTAWNRVRLRFTTPRHAGGRRGRGGVATTLFGGLLRCGKCGGAIIAASTSRYACAAHKDRGSSVCSGVAAPRKETDRRLVAVLRDEILSPSAIASIRARVQKLVADATQGAKVTASARRSRLVDLDGEIRRLTDAVAQLGLSEAIRERLTSAEAERDRLRDDVETVPTMPQPSPERISAKLRDVAMRLDDALKSDIPRARQIMADMLGPTIIEEAEDGIYAQMQIGPALRIAVGADVAGSGCGGRI